MKVDLDTAGRLITPADPDAPKRTVRARHAASVLVWRQAGARLEVLMGSRHASHRFMPHRLVFPGGRVDAADARGVFATPLRPETRALLERSANPRLAQAIAVAAARELEEETGLSLGHPPALDAFDYLCRAVTPNASPIRFNARFLVVPAQRVSGELRGSGELEGLRYYDVEEALGHDLVNAQRLALTELKRYATLSEDERRTRAQIAVFHNMRLRAE